MDGILTNSPHKIISNTILQSPVRIPRFPTTPLSPVSPGFGDFYPWKWSESARNIDLSPSSSCGGSPGFDRGICRGRPRAEMVAELRKAGSGVVEGNIIRCKICERVFPREKSLQAHMRTHTGERPYRCDYPNCGRAFVQSGQLKTHQRLHTGEKPFACSVPGCQSRFTHANRHCPEHPYAGLRRETTQVSVEDVLKTDENSEAVALWLQRYAEGQQKSKTVGCGNGTVAESLGISSMSTTPTSSRSRISSASRKRLRALSEGDASVERERSGGETPQRKRPSVRRLLQEQQEKMMGAMALIELAQHGAREEPQAAIGASSINSL